MAGGEWTLGPLMGGSTAPAGDNGGHGWGTPSAKPTVFRLPGSTLPAAPDHVPLAALPTARRPPTASMPDLRKPAAGSVQEGGLGSGGPCGAPRRPSPSRTAQCRPRPQGPGGSTHRVPAFLEGSARPGPSPTHGGSSLPQPEAPEQVQRAACRDARPIAKRLNVCTRHSTAGRSPRRQGPCRRGLTWKSEEA